MQSYLRRHERIGEDRYRVWTHPDDLSKPREQMNEIERLRDVLTLTFQHRINGLPCWCSEPCEGPEQRSHTCTEARALLGVPEEPTLKTQSELDYDAFIAVSVYDQSPEDMPRPTIRQRRRARRYRSVDAFAGR